jgi:arabinogalactan oligomer / maltooligosaccharide transport system permease protein
MNQKQSALEGRETPVSRPSGFSFTGALVLKLVTLMALTGLVLAGLPVMFNHHEYVLAAFSIAATLAMLAIFLSPRRFIPGKYLLPGTLFLTAFAIYPVIFTIYNSTTNYGTGHNVNQAQAIAQIEKQSVGSSEGAVHYDLQIIAQGDAATGKLAFLLTDPDGKRSLGTDQGLAPLTVDKIIKDGRRDTIAGYVALNTGAAQARETDVKALVVHGPTGDIVNDGFGNAFAKMQRLKYHADTNTVVDTVDGTIYNDKYGTYTSDKGAELLPGYRANVGVGQYKRLVTEEGLRNAFARVFIWTMVFAILSVVFPFGVGLFFALVFNHPRMRGQKIYRALMIIPYALPAYMSTLVWRGLMNTGYGGLNRMLHMNVQWLDGTWMPYVSLLLVNVWLGYPYMFLVCTGALQSIPAELTEAALIDGANGPARFRRVTFPLLLVAVGPLLVASFAFNFNNLVLIELLTGGGPGVFGSTAGRTDILISYTYRLAFAGGKGTDFGLSSAISVIIFLLVAGISTFGFRFTKRLEELRK